MPLFQRIHVTAMHAIQSVLCLLPDASSNHVLSPSSCDIPPANVMSTQTDQATQSDPDNLVRDLKLQNLLLKRENARLKAALHDRTPPVPPKPSFGVESVRNNDKKCRFYTGLSWLQFMCLWNFLGPAKEKLMYWNRKPVKDEEKSHKKRAGNKRSLSPLNECFLTLVRLRVGLLSMDLPIVSIFQTAACPQ